MQAAPPTSRPVTRPALPGRPTAPSRAPTPRRTAGRLTAPAAAALPPHALADGLDALAAALATHGVSLDLLAWVDGAGGALTAGGPAPAAHSLHPTLLADLAEAAAGAASSSSTSTAAAGRQDAGWLAPVAGALEATLNSFQAGLARAGVPYSYGWAIVALTAATKVITLPFTKKQVESSLAVQKLKPTIDEIKRLYGDDRDKVQREQSALYEKAGVDPAAGCAPTLLTLPIFWGLYRALSNVASDGTLADGFYWIPSLSGPTSVAAQRAGTGTAWLLPLDPITHAPPIGWAAAAPYLVLPALLVLAQYASSAIISPTPTADKDDTSPGALFGKGLIRLLPLMIGWFALNVPSGLALYYFANTLLTSAQQIWLRKLGGATAFEFQQAIGPGQGRRAGPVGALVAPEFLEMELTSTARAAEAEKAAADAAAAAAAGRAAASAGTDGAGQEAASAVPDAAKAAAVAGPTRSKRKRRVVEAGAVVAGGGGGGVADKAKEKAGV
jgi:YidC/Oxa1 family membrane protein insertase